VTIINVIKNFLYSRKLITKAVTARIAAARVATWASLIITEFGLLAESTLCVANKSPVIISKIPGSAVFFGILIFI